MTSPARDGFHAGLLEEKYAFLDALPERLYDANLQCVHGTLRERTLGLLQWRAALLEGRAPEPSELAWPKPPHLGAICASLEELGIARFCRGQPELTDSLLGSVLEWLDRGAAAETGALSRIRADLEARARAERTRTESAPGGDRATAAVAPGPSGEDLDRATLDAILLQARDRARSSGLSVTTDGLRSEWAERVRVWCEVEQVLGPMGELTGIGWDLSRTMLRSQGWLETVRLAKLLEALPALREVVRSLGRLQTSDSNDLESVAERIFGPVRRATEERREVDSPLVHEETRGVERSGELQRMLPSEAALLGHPVLKRLWHARRAERSLVSYRVSGTTFDRVLTESERLEGREERRPRPDRGPVIVCLDTSGSMAGGPETIAKAVVLEALRNAHRERRACLVFSFGGPGDVIELELDLRSDGLSRLVDFLTGSFHGGTDVDAPLRRAVARLQETRWDRADLLLVSDGEFPLPPGLGTSIEEARTRRGLRVHGLLIGDSSPAMEAICAPLHRFSDWSALLERG